MFGRYPRLGSDAVFYYSLATLFLLPFWYLSFARNGMPIDRKFVEHYYELSQIFDHVDYFSGILLSLILALVFLIAAYGIEAGSERLRRILDSLLALSALSVLVVIVWHILFPPSGSARITDAWIWGTLGVWALGLAMVGGAALLFRERFPGVLRTVVLWTFPIGIVMAANAVVAAYKIAPADGGFFAVDRSLAPLQTSRDHSQGRVLVMVLDMWDQYLTFEARSPDAKLPEIDRFKDTAFFAANAQRTDRSTLLAIPAMVTGRKVDRAWHTSGDELSLVFSGDSAAVPWREHPGVFAAARENGYNTAVVTTAYHPICRMFRTLISDCWIDDIPFLWTRKNVFTQIDDVVAQVLRRVPFVNRVLFEPRPRYHDEWGIHLYFAYLEKIKQLASDPTYDFIFVHWLLPHPPFIRNHLTDEFVYFDEQASRDFYWGNLEALDRAIGEIRTEMEGAGLWDDTTVILTADHGYVLHDWDVIRGREDPRVPFLAKLRQQRQPVVYEAEFSMVGLAPFLTALFRGEVSRPDEIGDWLAYPDSLD